MWDDDSDEDLCTLALPILFDLVVVVVPRVKAVGGDSPSLTNERSVCWCNGHYWLLSYIVPGWQVV